VLKTIFSEKMDSRLRAVFWYLITLQLQVYGILAVFTEGMSSGRLSCSFPPLSPPRETAAKNRDKLH
jgi:hypothetical protein